MRVAWRVSSGPHSDDPGLLVEGGGHWDLNVHPRWVEGPSELCRPELVALCAMC